MEERRLGPVVGLGTWKTFDGDTALARDVVGASGSPPWFGADERRLVERLAGA